MLINLCSQAGDGQDYTRELEVRALHPLCSCHQTMQGLKGSDAGSFLILSASDGSFAQPRGMAFLGKKNPRHCPEVILLHGSW